MNSMHVETRVTRHTAHLQLIFTLPRDMRHWEKKNDGGGVSSSSTGNLRPKIREYNIVPPVPFIGISIVEFTYFVCRLVVNLQLVLYSITLDCFESCRQHSLLIGDRVRILLPV